MKFSVVNPDIPMFLSFLSHCCPAVRACTALHLEQLLDIIGEDEIFAPGKIISERLLIAVSKMAVDAAPEVR